ncbi:MAG: hypothetical protein M1813_008904 [Trichoglossum hirsutum]|nr:MAG: hypothetical protein M1813_008904 [Trichoglossum hirsutum]
MNPGKIVQGVFAINKPPAKTSAQIIRDLQQHFNPSKLFAPWLAAEKERRNRESHNQRQRRRNQQIQVKIGHGGTLDPIATGVLILGVGTGTKALPAFLECTKTYEAVVLFGVATDSYDCVGKILGRAPYSHIAKEGVEEALQQFRGEFFQRPPVFSALRVQGKQLYKYAREGKKVPVEIQKRRVVVTELELVEWMEGGTHPFTWPEEETEQEEQEMAKQAPHAGGAGSNQEALDAKSNGVDYSAASTGKKRKWGSVAEVDQIDNEPEIEGHKRRGSFTKTPTSSLLRPSELPQPTNEVEPASMTKDTPSFNRKIEPPAAKIRMTVTSGFYVRSLCHDLGQAVGSMGIMSQLVRTRQGKFSLGENILEYDDLAKGEEEWGPKVSEMLSNWTKETG